MMILYQAWVVSLICLSSCASLAFPGNQKLQLWELSESHNEVEPSPFDLVIRRPHKYRLSMKALIHSLTRFNLMSKKKKLAFNTESSPVKYSSTYSTQLPATSHSVMMASSSYTAVSPKISVPATMAPPFTTAVDSKGSVPDSVLSSSPTTITQKLPQSAVTQKLPQFAVLPSLENDKSYRFTHSIRFGYEAHFDI